MHPRIPLGVTKPIFTSKLFHIQLIAFIFQPNDFSSIISRIAALRSFLFSLLVERLIIEPDLKCEKVVLYLQNKAQYHQAETTDKARLRHQPLDTTFKGTPTASINKLFLVRRKLGGWPTFTYSDLDFIAQHLSRYRKRHRPRTRDRASSRRSS